MWFWRSGQGKRKKEKGKSEGIGLFAFCLFTFALATLSGCALFVPREEVSLKQATVEELTALLSQREAAIQTMKGLFSAKVRGGIIPIASRVEGALYYRRPNAMRLRGFTAVGSELFEFVQADDQFRLRLPTMGRVLSGSPSDMSEMGKLARPFQLSVWAMGGVLGTGTIVKNETVALVEEGDRYRLDVFGPSPNGAQLMRRRLWFERQTLLVVREDRLTESGAVEATIQYEDFRTIGEAEAISSAGDRRLLRPFKIVLEDGKGQGSVQITFHEMIPNQPLSATDLAQL
jgi:outer membrane lipoprotein-sorting protein